MKILNIIVAHPQMQHSMKTANALKKAHYLKYYETINYFYLAREKQILSYFSHIPSADRFIKRCIDSGLDDNEVQTHLSFFGILLEIVARIDKKGLVYYKLYNLLSKEFGKCVARDAIKYSADAVIMYDYTAVSCFEFLKAKTDNIVKILDMSSIPTIIIDKIISEEEKKGFKEQFKLKRKRYSHKYCKIYNKEILLADYFISPSKSVTDALLELHVSSDKIFQVPFGVDLHSFNTKNRITNNIDNVVKFLYVGRMEAAKGLFYLLEAFESISDRSKEFRLILVGDSCGNQDLFLNVPYIDYRGIVSKEQMIDIYHECDVFVFPSLWEGCSLSLMEALASGLPAIATERSGVLQFIKDGESGFCIPGSSSSALKEKILWFLDNKDNIAAMGQLASKGMNSYSWDNYNNEIAKIIDAVFCNI